MAEKKTAFPTVAGILTIVSACFCAIIALIGVNGIDWSRRFYNDLSFYFFLLGLIAFMFGVISGTSSLKRRHFTLSLIGICLTMVFDSFLLSSFTFRELLSLLPVPVFMMSIISLIFIGISKEEFS
jgi:hypothetical protein